jgi:hypothetical protein
MRPLLNGGTLGGRVNDHHHHVDLFIVGARPGATQPVEVERLDSGDLLVLYSPGLVEGIAAGDVIKITDPSLGRFEVVRRGRNLAVKFAAPHPIADLLPSISADLDVLGGRLDGAIEKAAVWTVPAHAGFKRIENVMSSAVARTPASDWWYGNVYDDVGQPLRWWEKP